ncbi:MULTISPECIES: methyl-accepting chemotaxis protein [unclassified Clostridium]|uniref:methyl-accepting chemotaxis protein n=1 Tax=unclassified Clostridium TaxID=2614128 RepID=UPI000297B439|nr:MULTISPECIES: methyl-accepting chemotaxis protein [unclassified Clostridium]EKQ50929.1 MAG: methyl-accepting chemotaxis protein [Clostridium sp. Maddingley MBC34-26]
MISMNGVGYLKAMSELQADMISGGVIYLISEEGTITWKKPSKVFDLDIFSVGQKLGSNSIAVKALREKRTLIENVPRSLYGMRLKTIAEPLVNENGEAVGVFSIVFPRLHPVAKAFGDFAPILVEMFPEGAFIYMTDLQKVAYRQTSKKFDMTSMETGYELKDDDIAFKAIKSKQIVTMEIDSSKYGVPVLATSYPLFDEDNPSEVVATLGLIIPKVVAANLKEASENLENGISGVASAIEELAASASQIHLNEQELNKEIKEVINMSEEINEISSFIKKIADETKMLGLNAAIEAARAGEAGKGFGVVAGQIRKLSEQSKSTVPQIQKLTDSIKIKVEEASEMSKSSLASSQEQAAASEQITATVEELSATAAELNRIAKKL